MSRLYGCLVAFVGMCLLFVSAASAQDRITSDLNRLSVLPSDGERPTITETPKPAAYAPRAKPTSYGQGSLSPYDLDSDVYKKRRGAPFMRQTAEEKKAAQKRRAFSEYEKRRISARDAHQAEKRGIQLSIGGYMEQWVGFVSADSNSDFQKADQQSDVDIYINGEARLDHNILAGAEVVFDTEQDPDLTKYAYAYIQSDFGRWVIGNHVSSTTAMQVITPDVGWRINEYGNGQQRRWVGTPADHGTYRDEFSPLYSTVTTLGDGNSKKISIYTPRVDGLQVGFSYIPDSNFNGGRNAVIEEDTVVVENQVLTQGYTAAVNYKGALSEGIDLEAMLGYQAAKAYIGINPKAASAGINLRGYGATLGFSYAKHIDGVISNITTPSLADDTSTKGYSYDVGAAYDFGRLSMSALYFYGEIEGNTLVSSQDRQKTLSFGTAYELTKGVELASTLAWTRVGEENGNELEGTYIILGSRFKF
ncbi:MAG: porin [Alphaproteobacteria bacterium]